jgi:hypothetical protein
VLEQDAVVEPLAERPADAPPVRSRTIETPETRTARALAVRMDPPLAGLL